jgi:L-amino acid N-acyltransferase YncA
MTAEHADGVLAIYQADMDEGNATCEIRAPAWRDFAAARLPADRFVILASALAALYLTQALA